MCTHLIRRFIYALPSGEIFVTRQLLNFGKRGAVDMCLYLMVKLGFIRRLAWGMFVRIDPGVQHEFSVEEIAKKKAAAFGKELTEHPKSVATEVDTAVGERVTPIFYTDGSSSSFRALSVGVRVKFQKLAPRKASRLGNSKVGKAIRSLWHAKERKLDEEPGLLAKTLRGFTKPEELFFNECIEWMPEWLTARCTSGSPRRFSVLTEMLLAR